MASGYLYVIKDEQTSLTKIGITNNWRSRLRTLKVGKRTECKIVIQVSDNREWEKRLHKKYGHWRLVGTEWFNLDAGLEQELISELVKIGTLVEQNKQDAESDVEANYECWWSTEQGRNEASMLIHSIDEDDITELKLSNPWVDLCSIPHEDEWTETNASIYFSFWLPKSLGGKLSEIFIEPDGTPEGYYFDYESNGNKWMVQTFDAPPKGITDVIDRLWLLRKLDKSEWPLKVVAKWDKLKKNRAEVEEKAGPPLPKKLKEREEYIKRVVEERSEQVAKDFILAYMRAKIQDEWKEKKLNIAPDNPRFIYNAEICAEAELRYAKGFRVSNPGSQWCKVGPDGKWIECSEHEASL